MAFRIYRTKIEWFNETKRIIESTDVTINLVHVHSWEACNNEEHDFEDDKERTVVRHHNGKIEIIPVSYEKFSKTMTDYLRETSQLDTGSLPGRMLIPYAKFTYEGPVKLFFNQDKYDMLWSFFPKDVKISSPQDAIINCLSQGEFSYN